VQEGFHEALYVLGYDLVALVGGVGVVGLHHAGDAVDVFEQEGQDGDVEFAAEGRVVGGEGVDVVGAVVGGEGDSGDGDFGTGLLKLRDHGLEVGAGGLDLEAAEAVVAAELEDDDLGFHGQDAGEAVDSVLGGVAADALVDDAVVEAFAIEVLLEEVGVALAFVGSVAGGERIAEADEERTFVGSGIGFGRGRAGGFGGAGRFFGGYGGGSRSLIHIRRSLGRGVGLAAVEQGRRTCQEEKS